MCVYDCAFFKLVLGVGCENVHTFIHDLVLIETRKGMLQNIKKILKECFLGTT